MTTKAKLISSAKYSTVVVTIMKSVHPLTNTVRQIAVVEWWDNNEFNIEVELDNIPTTAQLKEKITVSDFPKFESGKKDMKLSRTVSIVYQKPSIAHEDELALTRKLRSQFAKGSFEELESNGWKIEVREVQLKPPMVLTLI